MNYVPVTSATITLQEDGGKGTAEVFHLSRFKSKEDYV